MTQSNVVTVLYFLAAYQGAPNKGQYKAALNALIYLFSIPSFGLAYHSDTLNFTKSFVCFPSQNGTEAYLEATPPLSDESHESTLYSDACWVSQIRFFLADGKELPL